MAEPEDKAKQNQTDGSDPVSPAPTTPAESFLARMTIAGCLLGKEIYRNKLKWFDLRRADLRLGEKAYQTRAFSGQTQLVSQLDQLRDEEAKLRQRDDRATSTFSERLKVLIRVAIGAVQAAVLQVKRQRLLAQLGGMIRRDNEMNDSAAEEVRPATAVAARINSLDAEITQLRSQTYPWARRPLLLSGLLLLLIVASASVMRREDHGTELSEEQFKTLQSQTAAFAEQLRRQQAEMSRQEAEDMQNRIAAAERKYEEERKKKQLDREKKERERAQSEEVARREQAEREKQQEKAAAAERVRLEQEREQAERLAREKAERERVEQEKAAVAQKARLEEEKHAAQLAEEKRQREQAEHAAQYRPATEAMRSRIKQGEATATAAMASLPKYPFPYDPELLDKLYEGRLEEIGPNRLDLVAVAKAFQRAGAIELGRELISGITVDGLTTVQMHPNYWMTAGILDATDGLEGDWARTTSANLTQVLRDRTEGKFSSNTGDTGKAAWPLKMRLVVPVDDSDFKKPMQGLNETERAAVEKQIKELAAKGAKVYLADYGDPNARSNYHDVHLAFWYGDVPILRRDFLAVSKAHPLANLGNIAVTEVPQTLGEANRKHDEAVAIAYKKVETKPNVDNPRYVGWKGFRAGASATYAKNTWQARGGQKQPSGNGSTEVRTLQSIDSANARVDIDGKVQTFAAKVRDERSPDELKAPTQEEVELNGKTFQCSRRTRQWKDFDRRVTTTTWMSDEVPGGLVRLLEDEEDPNGLHVLDDITLQSFTGGKSGDWSGKPSGIPLLKTVFNFKGETGVYPKGPLIQASDGNFYGTTSNGPPSGDASVPSGRGTVFKLTPDGVLSTLHVFNGNDGASPAGGLTKGKDGSFYGTTNEDGTRPWGKKQTTGRGTVFRITPSGQLTTLHTFAGMPDGWGPVGELIEAKDGNFYGTTREGGDKCAGGTYGCGTVFKITPKGELTILHRFSELGEEGRFPEAGLVEGGDGKFYGTTLNGGKTVGGRFLGDGAIFAISPTGELTKLHTFLEENKEGQNPVAGLVRGEAEEFYGVSERGGQSFGTGVLFKVASSGDYSVLHSFALLSGGQKPRAGLLRAADGSFYGSTVEAKGGFGSVFRFTPPDSLTTLYVFGREFTEQRNFGFGQGQINDKARWAEQELAAGRDHPEYTDGSYPNELIEAADGTLWGTTEKGGIWDSGTVFRINPKAFKEPTNREQLRTSRP